MNTKISLQNFNDLPEPAEHKQIRSFTSNWLNGLNVDASQFVSTIVNTSNGITYSYLQPKKAEPIGVLIPGAYHSEFVYAYLLALLAQENLPFAALTLPGSAGLPSVENFATFIEICQSCIEHLQVSPHILNHSMGAIIALFLLEKLHSVQSLISINPVGNPKNLDLTSFLYTYVQNNPVQALNLIVADVQVTNQDNSLTQFFLKQNSAFFANLVSLLGKYQPQDPAIMSGFSLEFLDELPTSNLPTKNVAIFSPDDLFGGMKGAGKSGLHRRFARYTNPEIYTLPQHPEGTEINHDSPFVDPDVTRQVVSIIKHII